VAGRVARQGSSPKTIQNIRGETVSPIFEAACLPGEDDEPPLRTYNPLKGLKLPERDRPEREIVKDQQEAALVIEADYEVDPSAADLMLVLLATGMRWGEAAVSAPVTTRRSGIQRRQTGTSRNLPQQIESRFVHAARPGTQVGFRRHEFAPERFGEDGL
jgi:hypothetical protein